METYPDNVAIISGMKGYFNILKINVFQNVNILKGKKLHDHLNPTPMHVKTNEIKELNC